MTCTVQQSLSCFQQANFLHIYKINRAYSNLLAKTTSAINFSREVHLGVAMEGGFKLPSPLPSWPPGDGFAQGTIDLGGLVVHQASTFTKIWSSHEGGLGDLGATFYKPANIPTGFSMLGCYCQPNIKKQLFGWVLAGKGHVDESNGGPLRRPVDYTLTWSSREGLPMEQHGHAYIWLPTPPPGYATTGYVVTNAPEKPSLDEIRCVRSDFCEPCEKESLIWWVGGKKTKKKNAFCIYELRPLSRGIQASGVRVGTFMAEAHGAPLPPLVCLRQKSFTPSYMPNLNQINRIMQAYSPIIYFHPDEKYLPCSVSWYFTNGALLYKQGDPSVIQVHPSGCNLPQSSTASNDRKYWLGLPNVKPMLGGTFTDVVIWIFYPFNGPGRAKVGPITIPLGRIGGHGGDWEHLTLRVSNFNGELWRVYFSQHSGGEWVDASELEFQEGNMFAAYASLNGHSFYNMPGLVLMSDEPQWLNFASNWGQKVRYCIGKLLPWKVKLLPSELLGEEGPVGPKQKSNWSGDEV